ncbi:transcriptional corepressor seuss [Quercus suber]|uniref:Transcriptional corepressor seuss n=1 Tax=Quercus suber TaxID=58331 RepID=A0AAW0LQX8_QUESU
MHPSGSSTSVDGAQSVSPALIRSKSAILGSQGGLLPPQAAFSSVGPPRECNLNLVGHAPYVSSFLNQTFGSGGLNTSVSGLGVFQRGSGDTTAGSDSLSTGANDIGFSPPIFAPSNMTNSGSSNKFQNSQISTSYRNPMLPNQQQSQNVGTVKPEPQQNQMGRSIRPIKLEHHHSDQVMLLQQQQHPFHQRSRQSSQAVNAQISFLQQQRIMQLQQQENQQLLKNVPEQQPHLHKQFQQQTLPIRSAVRPIYEPGMCARRLTQYMHQQQHRPEDNNIEFWRKFVAEFFAPNARKKWCVSLYGTSHQTNGVFPQDVWHCDICNCKPGRGFETTVEVLPRLFKIKYDSGTSQELLFVDMPHEYENTSGQIVLEYAKAIQESVFEQLRVVWDGQLRLIFSPDLKVIFSWQFCARHHEELIPRRILIPQLSQVGAAAQKYQASAENASTNSSSQDLQINCNMFVASARQLAKTLEVPLVNDVGYTKRYVRCLQIAEVVNVMKDLIDYSQQTGKGPIESLANFPCVASSLSKPHNSVQQIDEQQQIMEEKINDQSLQGTAMQPSSNNCVTSVNNSQSTTSTLTSATSVVGLLHENSMNSRHEYQMNTPSSPYAGTPGQIPSAGSSTTMPPDQLNPSSPFLSPTLSSSYNPPQTSHNALTVSATSSHRINLANSPKQIPLQHSSQSEANLNESQSSIEKILQEIMNSSQYNGDSSLVSVGSLGSNMNNVNCHSSALTSTNSLVGNGIVNKNNSGLPCGRFGNQSGSIGLSNNASGMRTAMGNNYGTLTGRVGVPLMRQDANMNLEQQELANGFLNAVNGFNGPQFDWKYP